jgi:hypothetical protein
VRDQGSHPLRSDSGRSSNHNRHLSPSVNTSRLPGNDLQNDGFGQLRSWHIGASAFDNASLISFQTYPLGARSTAVSVQVERHHEYNCLSVRNA